MNNNRNFNRGFRHTRGRQRVGRGYGNRGTHGFWPRGGGASRGFGGPSDIQNFRGRDFNQFWEPTPRPSIPSRRLSEKDIAATEYMNEHEGFNGIIKSRFSDFQVSEVNEKGEIAKLTDLSPPEPPTENDVVEDEYLLLNKYNPEILPMETWDMINKVATSTEKNVEKVKIDVTGKTKEERTKIHDSVKKAFGDSIVGSTVTLEGKKFVTFEKYRKGVRIDNRVKWVWPGEYVYFVVYKENCDTMEAASRIAERLRMNLRPSMLGYAGNKDRRAKTSQWFSVRKYDPRKIASSCQGLRDITVGNYSFSDCGLKLGMLRGNQFRICLRNVTGTDECVDTACSLLRDQGFINYAGLQRFGTRIEVPTYEIGKNLLQANFWKAITCILAERPGPMSRALQVFHAAGARDAVRFLPRAPKTIESRLLGVLANNEKDLVGALDQVTRNTRLLYIHSYQSLVWNRVVSERLRTLGRQPVPGDLVPLAQINEGDMEEESDSEEYQNDDTGLSNEETKSDKTELSKELNNPEKKVFRSRTMIPVKVLTQEDCDSGQYSLCDVVMPLPGNSVQYPPNMREYYRKLLEEDGLKLDMRHKYRSYRMCGGYRPVVARPADMTWTRVRYNDPGCDLLLSDADRLAGVTSTGATDDGKYKALLLTMTLPPSSYATMALRELAKVDTSGSNQASQNNYHKQNDQEVAETDDANEGEVDKDDEAPNGDGQGKGDEVETGDKELENGGDKRKLDVDSDGGDVKKLKQNE